MSTQLDGTCFICSASHSRAEMTRHLEECLARAAERHSDRALLIRADATSAPHWLCMLAPATATLTHLDDFLREIWLECCGHLSEFNVDGTRYAIDCEDFTDFGPARESMDVRVGEVLDEGLECQYTYDFGTATRVSLTCHGDVDRPSNGAMPDEVIAFGSTPVRGVARNESPEVTCEGCGEPAAAVCAHCFVRGEGFVCETHRDVHDCSYPDLLPVLNSPRMGVCGYTG